MAFYGAQQRIEVIKRPIYFHTDGFRGNWGTFTIVAGNAVAYDNDTLNQNNAGGPGDGIVDLKVITPVVSTGTDRYLIVRVNNDKHHRVYLWNTGTATWEVQITAFTAGTRSKAIPAGTYNQIRFETTSASDVIWDYVAISRYGLIVVDSTVNDVWRRDEKERVSEAVFVADHNADLASAYRGFIKIWMAGGKTSTLVKQFTGKISKISQIGTRMLKQLKINALSNMFDQLDREVSISFKYKENADNAILSVVDDLVTDSSITVRSVVDFSEIVEMEYKINNMCEVIQDIAQDPRVNASMYMDFDGDLNFFKYGSRDSSESIVHSDITSPYMRVDDASPGMLVNSATVYGAWTAFWPTNAPGESGCESYTNSDLIESAIGSVWYNRPAGGTGSYRLSAVQGGMVGTSELIATFHKTIGLATPDIIVGRTFYPWVDGREFSQMYWYWQSSDEVSAIAVICYGVFPSYYLAYLKPDYSDRFVVDRWGGDPYVETQITMMPYGNQALDIEGNLMWRASGNPSWKDIKRIEVFYHFVTPQDDTSVIMDGMYFGGFRWKGGWKDVNSTQSYGSCVRSYEGEYQSNEECASVAYSIVQKYKDPTVTVDRLVIKPRVTLVQTERIHISFPVLDDKLVIDEIHLNYTQGKLTTEVQLGETRQGYLQYEREKRRKERMLKELQDESARRRNVQYGRFSKYMPR